MKVTVTMLKKMHACEGQRDRFRELYPRGLVIPPPGDARDQLAARLRKEGFAVRWFVRRRRLTAQCRNGFGDLVRYIRGEGQA